MNEQELKHAFREVVASSPPSMNPAHALDVARKARSKRRASTIGAVVATLVVGIGIGSAFAFSPGTAEQLILGSGASSSAPSTTTVLTKPRWEDVSPEVGTIGWSEDGRIDLRPDDPSATFNERLMLRLQAFAQANGGFQTGPLKTVDPNWKDFQLLFNRVSLDEPRGGDPVWTQYVAHVPIRRSGDNKVGDLHGFVFAAKAQMPPCELAQTFMANAGAPCQLITVGGKQVAVASHPGRAEVELWATYQEPGGVVVTIGVSRTHYASGAPKLDEVPFTGEQLAALAVDPASIPAI